MCHKGLLCLLLLQVDSMGEGEGCLGRNGACRILPHFSKKNDVHPRTHVNEIGRKVIMFESLDVCCTS